MSNKNIPSMTQNLFLWRAHAKIALPCRMTETSTSHVKLRELSIGNHTVSSSI